MWKKFKQLKQIIMSVLHRDNYHYPSRQVVIDGLTVQIREIVENDVKELLAVERDVYRGELPWTRSAFLSELHAPMPRLYLAVLFEGEIIAFIGCRFIGNEAHITNVAVHSDYQGQGIGTFLLEEIQRFAIMNGCEAITLEVRMSNHGAQRLYRKMGYVSTAIKRGYYTENNEDALDMRLQLKESE